MDEEGVPITELPIPVLMQQMIHPDRERSIGQRYRIAHLKSARGATLNGKLCVVQGFDRKTTEARLHCRIINDDESKSGGEETIVKLKVTNLVPMDASQVLDHFMEHSPPLENTRLTACLEHSLEKHGATPTDRSDLAHRLRLYRDLLNKLKAAERNSTPLTEQDYCFPCGAGSELMDQDNAFGVLMNSMRPACYGTEVMDMRHVDIGLRGDGRTPCPICSEPLDPDESSVLVTLPCLHIFHDTCVVRWLESDLGSRNWNCPSCRAPVPEDMSTYRVNYDEQLQRRVDEYPLSGFCTKCMVWNMERDRNQVLGYQDADGTLRME